MAQARYSRLDNKRSPSSYCSTVTIVVFVALCLVGVWMMTSSSSSVVSVHDEDVSPENKNTMQEQSEVKKQATDTTNSNTRQFEDKQGDLPVDATQGDSTVTSENNSDKPEKKPEKFDEQPEVKSLEDGKITYADSNENAKKSDSDESNKKSDSVEDSKKAGSDDDNKKSDSNESENKSVPDESEKKSESDESNKKSDSDESDKKSNSDVNEQKTESSESEKKSESNDDKQSDSGESETKSESNDDKQSDSGESEIKTDKSSKTTDNKTEEKVDQSDNQESDESSNKKKTDDNTNNQDSNEVLPLGGQAELLNENTTQTGSFSTQAAESKKENESQDSSKKSTGYNWKLCNVTAGPDYIPCLDNLGAIRTLKSTKHYEHRERQCPEEPPTCLVSLPEGYKRPIEWPKSREKVEMN